MMNLHAGGPQGQMSQRACGFLARLRQAELQVWRKPGSGAAGAKEVRENWVVPPGLRGFFLPYPALKRGAKLTRPSGGLDSRELRGVGFSYFRWKWPFLSPATWLLDFAFAVPFGGAIVGAFVQGLDQDAAEAVAAV